MHQREDAAELSGDERARRKLWAVLLLYIIVTELKAPAEVAEFTVTSNATR